MINPLIAARKVAVQIGDTIEVFIGNSDQLDKAMADAIRKGLARGLTIKHADGSKEWHTHSAIVNLDKQGSQMFIWDKAGQRVKQNKIRVQISPTGERTETIIGTVFRNW